MNDLRFKITSWLLAAGVLFYIPGFLPFRSGKIILVENVIFAAITEWLIKNIWIKLFLAWCIIRASIGINKYSELTLHMVVFVLVLHQILSDKLTKERINQLLNIICVSALIQSFVIILQYFGVWIITWPKGVDPKTATFSLFPDNSLFSIRVFAHTFKYQLCGLLEGIDISSAFLAMCFPAFLRKKWCWGLIGLIVGLILSSALGGMVSVIICTLVWAALKGKKYFIPTGIAVITALLIPRISSEIVSHISTQYSGLFVRLNVWWFHFTQIIPKRPIIGWGLGQGEFLYPIIKNEVMPNDALWLHSHNEIVTLITELGIIGLILVAGYFISTFKKLGKRNIVVTCGLVSCIASALSIFSMHQSIGLLLIIYMAMAQYLITSNGDNKCAGI